MTRKLELFLFTPDPELAARSVAAGVDGIVVDWERDGKERRQARADTEINHDTLADLRRIRAAVRARILCRINAFGSETGAEIEGAIEAGADEVLLPMVRNTAEIEQALEIARGRLGVGIVVETIDAVDSAPALAALRLSRVFVGLNDLAIDTRSPSIFTPLVDGTVDRVRAAFSIPFGVAGLTVVDKGEPIPCRLLVAELARLRCDFTFLRRSFRRDVLGRDLEVEVVRMGDASRRATLRSSEAVRRDRDELVRAVDDVEASVRELSPALHD